MMVMYLVIGIGYGEGIFRMFRPSPGTAACYPSECVWLVPGTFDPDEGE